MSWWATRFMLRRAGLQPLYRMPGRQTEAVPVNGIIIGGGDDIEPLHYGAVGDGMAEYDLERDHFEIDILKRALMTSIPVLGICRGAQLINVVLGGTLYQDLRPLRRRTPNLSSAFPVKIAWLVPGSRLSGWMETRWTRVNSLHHQAVERLAGTLRVAAVDSDDFVQAIEDPRRRFLVGVQWHPEYLPYKRTQRRLFAAFADAVRVTDVSMSL